MAEPGDGLTERHEIARGGEHVLVRPFRREDAPLYKALVADESAEDLQRRFFAHARALSREELDHLRHLDYDRNMAFAAVDETTGRLLGLVRLNVDLDNENAQFAIMVASNAKGHGLGPMLMKRMIEFARTKPGLRRVYGDVLSENERMLQMCAELGFRPDDLGDGITRVILDL